MQCMPTADRESRLSGESCRDIMALAMMWRLEGRIVRFTEQGFVVRRGLRRTEVVVGDGRRSVSPILRNRDWVRLLGGPVSDGTHCSASSVSRRIRRRFWLPGDWEDVSLG